MERNFVRYNEYIFSVSIRAYKLRCASRYIFLGNSTFSKNSSIPLILLMASSGSNFTLNAHILKFGTQPNVKNIFHKNSASFNIDIRNI